MDNRQIGMAQLAVCRGPGIIRSSGLGSCIGIALYDPFNKIGGMAHAMLPKHRAGREGNRAKYVDTAVEAMLNEMEAMGCSKVNIVAKLAGGAQMFRDADKENIMMIGQKNIKAAEDCLQELGIPIIARDTGGHCGRTLEFNCQDGGLYIKTINNEAKI